MVFHWVSYSPKSVYNPLPHRGNVQWICKGRERIEIFVPSHSSVLRTSVQSFHFIEASRTHCTFPAEPLSKLIPQPQTSVLPLSSRCLCSFDTVLIMASSSTIFCSTRVPVLPVFPLRLCQSRSSTAREPPPTAQSKCAIEV